MRRRSFLTLPALTLPAWAFAGRDQQADPRVRGAFRRPEKNGWHYVHLEGAPADIGFQHGYLLAGEIQDNFRVAALSLTHGSPRDLAFFRRAAETVLWPRIEAEYRQEIEGIAQGVAARGIKMDVWDVVVLNAFLELAPYYTGYLDQLQGKPSREKSAPEHCSAFVATGSYTKDGKVVIAHNNWSDYMQGERWNVIFDIAPRQGHRFVMDGMPGLIHSGDDFGINAAGLMTTETTISQFSGFDPNGIPEFVRARKAMQYAGSIDEFAALMKEGNNGGYANNWLVADRKTNEIASLELGLKHVTLQRTHDGYFVGSNFPVNNALIQEETKFDVNDAGSSPNARRARAEQIMKQNRGKIDIRVAQKYVSDHIDSTTGKEEPNERTLCGHIDLARRGSQPWQPPYGPAGAVQAKVSDARMAESMTFLAAMGHPCGITFRAGAHLKEHPEFRWQAEVLKDLRSYPWTTFTASSAPR